MAGLVIELINGEKAGASLQLVNKELREAKKAVDKAVVGTDEWRKAMDNVGKAEGNIDKVKKQIQSTTSASDTLKKAFNNLPGASFFNQIADSFGMMKSGVGGLISQFGMLKTAIASTGLGLLVVLLGSLYTWFTKTERGGDLLSKMMSGLGAAINVLRDRASKLIDALIAFAKGDWTDAAKKFGEATKGVTEEIIAETKAAMELADALDALEELEGKLLLVRSRSKEQISELRLLAKDETKTLAERSAAIQKAIAIQQDLNKAELEAKQGRVLQALEVANLDELTKKYGVTLEELLEKGENILSVDNLGLGESTQEDLNKAFQALADYNNQVTTSNDEQRALFMELNKLKKKDRAEDTKDAKANAAEQAELAKNELTALQNIQDLKDSLIADAQDREIEQIWTQTQRKIEALVGSEELIAEQKALLQEQEILAVQAVVDKYALEAKAKKEVDLQKKADDDKKASDKAIENSNREAEEKQEVEQAYRDFASGSLQELINVLGEDEKARKKNAQAIKAFTIAKILVDLQSEIAGLNASPGSTFTLGAAGAVKAALAVVRAGLAIKKVGSQKFRTGGILRGPLHEQGGIGMMVRGRMVAEAEGGEPILTAAVSRNPYLLAAASRINVAAGGRPLLAEGGVTPSAASAAAPFDMDGFEQRIAAVMLAAMDKKITTLRVVNDPLQTASVIDGIKQIENEVNV